MTGPTQVCGHTLYVVLSHRRPVSNFMILDAVFQIISLCYLTFHCPCGVLLRVVKDTPLATTLGSHVILVFRDS